MGGMGGDKKERQNMVIFLLLAMAEIEKIQDTKNLVKFNRVFCVLDVNSNMKSMAKNAEIVRGSKHKKAVTHGACQFMVHSRSSKCHHCHQFTPACL